MKAPAHHDRPLLALAMRLGAAVMLSVMLVLVKLASEAGIALSETLFWRQAPTIPVLLAWFALRGQMGSLGSRRLPAHARRALIGLMGMFCNLGAVTLLPLTEATSFNFTAAIWAVVLSALILHEKIGPWRWAGVLAGFAGVLLIAQPGDSQVPLFGAAVALTGALLIALISILVRDLAQTEHPLSIVFWFSTFTVPLLALSLPFVATPHDAYEWWVLTGVGAFGLAGQVLLTAALRFGTVASVIVMDYSAIVWATLFGWLVFDHLPPSTTWLGAPLVIAAGLLIAWREHRLSRLHPVPPIVS